MIGSARTRRIDLTLCCACVFSVVAAFCLLAIPLVLMAQSLPVWKAEGSGYVLGGQWHYRGPMFGALPMIYGTVAVSAIAVLLAAPLGIGSAIFTSEYLQGRARLAVKSLVELLSGIPSVVYGLLGIVFLRNWVYTALEPFDPLSGDTLLTAGLLLAVMILPTVMTLSDDALRTVPSMQRSAARALGLNRAEAILTVAIPQAWPGFLSATLLGLGRALGETIAVYLVVGRQDNQLPESLFSFRMLAEAGQTLTSKLGGSETNIAYGDPLHWAAMVGLGLLLLAITVSVTLVGLRLRGKATRA